MNVLILGSGGREHAFAWKIAQSPRLQNLYIAPGNAGTAHCGTNADIQVNDFEAIKNFVWEKDIDLVLVGPEDPLVKGIHDYFLSDEVLRDIPVIGPKKDGAQLEGSKDFSKKFMIRHGVPTAAYETFTAGTLEEGYSFLETLAPPYVLKADGLAAGKGVLIIHELSEAKKELKSMLVDSKFGAASARVVIEEFLSGIELSVFVLTDGVSYKILPAAKDYKRIGEGDTGLNTGGMGAISPVPFANEAFIKKVEEKIVKPTIAGLRKDGIDYRGFIFIGLMNSDGEPKVIEYNCRMGDPETEVVFLRLQNDLVELLIAIEHQKLQRQKILINKNPAATIVAVSGGYPGIYEKGMPIEFNYLEAPEAIKHVDQDGGVMVFHGGTRQEGEQVLTNGGRVLAVSALAGTLGDAVELAKTTLQQIHYEGIYYRGDIGYEFVN